MKVLTPLSRPEVFFIFLSLIHLQCRQGSSANTKAGRPEVEYVNPPGLFKSPGFSHVAIVNHGRMVFIGAQGPVTEDGHLVGTDGNFRVQAEKVFDQLRLALLGAGATFENVVKINLYTSKGFDYSIYNELRQKYFSKNANLPVSTSVQVEGGADGKILIEMEAIAVVP